MENKLIINMSELEPDYHYTKIECAIEISQTMADDAHDRCNFVDINSGSSEIMQSSVYIGSQLCKSVSIKKLRGFSGQNHALNPLWKLEVIIEALVDKDDCSKIVKNYCCYMSCQIIDKVYNHTLGVPYFAYDQARLEISYGKNENEFDIKRVYGTCFGTSESDLTIEHNFSLPNIPIDMTEAADFLDSVSRSDTNSKFILLFSFLEKFLRSPNDEQIERGRTSRATRIYNALKDSDIDSVKINDEIRNISVDFFKDIVTVRDCLAHRRKADNLHHALYDRLLPTIMTLIFSELNHGADTNE
jgi:hypothetical protein